MKTISSNFKIIFAYALFGSLWIFYSDKILANLVNDIDTLNSIQSYKGWFFIFITSLLLYYLVNRYEKQRNKIEKELREKDILLIQQSKMAAMGEMIDNIAHQWKQPLNTISTTASGIKLQEELDILNNKTLVKEMDNITTSTKFLSETIDDFRNFFNTNKTKREFSLENCINKVLLLVNSKLRNRYIEVIKDINEYKVTGVENEIVQILMNIVNNAIDALDDSINDNKYIFIDTKIEEDKIYITIKDNAGGIDKNIINKIFESRFTTKKEGKGTGIGLYMSKIIINSYKGSISAKNSKFKYKNKEYIGAEFEVCIPIK
ncbi:sensor histidine kinase [Arcobacter sp. YIC-464]|uniref:sensor histidine kinase n=1 Tax=Arcobacter sp. YIC-464 TaxID=3376631 RepID=UPI003C1FA2AB